ncbi:hypothetical protein [Spirosoma oryzicola]|uniref:hypothetical protein n=1 Tax=Spirosoma oryzicola TaxID=2898794 RepID=UPI001E4590CE|nr:hypothetical protein [Spirosoma oryzicola]UHG94647.1 hypothetical protein LQ777_29050 [Spirosoma oryzicola]
MCYKKVRVALRCRTTLSVDNHKGSLPRKIKHKVKPDDFNRVVQSINRKVIIIYIVGIDSENKKQIVSFGNQSMEVCFDTLSILVEKGWLLMHLVLSVDARLIPLPVEAFDGKRFSEPLAQLKREWEAILAG